jgi:two-component system cell cycle response regulator CtrA
MEVLCDIRKRRFHDGEWTKNKATFIEQGGEYLLRAPVNPREMLACILSLKRRFEAIRPSMYLCRRALVVNTVLRSVTFNGTTLHLIGKEKLLFMDLADHFGQVRTKEQLSSNLYILDVDAAEIKIIDVFICRIRKKLNGHHPGLGGIIETVWGQGYRLQDTELENLREIG